MWSGSVHMGSTRILSQYHAVPLHNSLLGPHGALCVTQGYVHPEATHCDTLDISTEDKMDLRRAQQLTWDSAHKDISTPQDVTDPCPGEMWPCNGSPRLALGWGQAKPTQNTSLGQSCGEKTVKLTVHLSSLLLKTPKGQNRC